MNIKGDSMDRNGMKNGLMGVSQSICGRVCSKPTFETDERLYTYRYTVTTRMIPALRWAAMRAILMVH